MGIKNKIFLNKLLAMVLKRFPRVIVLILVSLLCLSAMPARFRTIPDFMDAQIEKDISAARMIETSGIGFYVLPGLS